MNHITHIEDLMFEGKLGFEKINRVFSHINQRKFENFTVKLDGAPAILFGTDPNDDQKFVAKKSIFNKKPIIYKSYKDINEHITNVELNEIMKHSLDILPKVFGVYQGDFLFSKRTKKTISSDQENNILFHPNVILYRIANNTDDHFKLQYADMGISFHTCYSMDSLYRLTKQKFIPLEIETVFQLPISVELTDIEYIPEVRYIEPIHDTKYYNSFIRANKDIPIETNFDMLYHNLGNIKTEILKAVKTPYQKFFKKDGVLIETIDEGLVYSDSEFTCKLINRREFSYANFCRDFDKGWQADK